MVVVPAGGVVGGDVGPVEVEEEEVEVVIGAVVEVEVEAEAVEDPPDVSWPVVVLLEVELPPVVVKAPPEVRDWPVVVLSRTTCSRVTCCVTCWLFVF